MSRRVSHWSIIRTIVAKDLMEYGRDRLWAFLTVLVLVVVVALFWVLPDDVDESLTIGIAGAEGIAEGLDSGSEQGLAIVAFDSAGDLRSVVAGEASAYVLGRTTAVVPSGGEPPGGAVEADVTVGIAFPGGFFAGGSVGPGTVVEVFVTGGVPGGLRATVEGLVREIGYQLTGQELPVTTAGAEVYTVLGTDRVGDQITLREGFRPLLVFLVLLMEMFVMSSIIAKEIQSKTVTALLVTPATTADVLAAKALAGAASGLTQAAVLLVALQALGHEPVLMLTLMLLGAVMVAGTAMIAGSAGRDFIGTLFYGMAFMIPLMIPAFSTLLPGTASVWIRALPSYPLIDGLVGVSSYGRGWSDTLPQLGVLAAWCVGLFAVGWLVLKRRVETA
jgi:ABC-2 type transport system permease protein